MSDRRPEMDALSSREGIVYRTLRDAQLGDLEQAAKDVITALHLAGQLAEPITVADIRRLMESGTIEGEVVRWCRTHNAESIENHGVGLSDECWRVVWVPHDEPEGVGNGYALCRIVERLVVSDGGSET